MNHIFDTEDEEQSSTQLKFLKTLIDKLIKGRKHPTGAPPSSRTTNYFYGEFRTNLKIHFLVMKKMKNSHPHVPHVPQVQPVGQEPQAPFRYGLHKGENTQRVLRHPLGRPTTFMVSFRTTCAEFRSIYGERRTIYAEFRSILRTQIQTYIILCLITVWR